MCFSYRKTPFLNLSASRSDASSTLFARITHCLITGFVRLVLQEFIVHIALVSLYVYISGSSTSNYLGYLRNARMCRSICISILRVWMNSVQPLICKRCVHLHAFIISLLLHQWIPHSFMISLQLHQWIPHAFMISLLLYQWICRAFIICLLLLQWISLWRLPTLLAIIVAVALG